MISKLWTLATLWRHRSLPPERLAALQLRKLRSVVDAARRDVPFYRDLYAQAGVEPGMPRTLDDLKRLPIVSRKQIQRAGVERMVSERLASKCRLTLHTSGTTGEPLTVLLSGDDFRTRSLVDFRCLLSLGFRPWEHLVTVGPGFARPQALHERLGIFRGTVIPGYLSLEEKLRRLERSRPDVLWCYPPELRLLLEAPGHPLRHRRPRLLISSACVLDAPLRRMAESELQVEIFVSYGAIETGRIAIECSAHRGLHINADYVLVEVLNGDRPAKPGETGEVVLTTLSQSAMPFIRYRIGDLTAWTGEPCPCGSTFPLIDAVHGRVAELLRFSDGVGVSPAVFDLVLRDVEDIDRYAMIQEAPDWLRLLMVPSRPWTQDETARVRHALLALVPPGVRVDIEFVDRIEDPHGKPTRVISKLHGE